MTESPSNPKANREKMTEVNNNIKHIFPARWNSVHSTSKISFPSRWNEKYFTFKKIFFTCKVKINVHQNLKYINLIARYTNCFLNIKRLTYYILVI